MQTVFIAVLVTTFLPFFFNDPSPTGMIRHGPRDVQREGAWGIERWEFEDDILPPYLVGGAYIMNSK